MPDGRPCCNPGECCVTASGAHGVRLHDGSLRAAGQTPISLADADDDDWRSKV